MFASVLRRFRNIDSRGKAANLLDYMCGQMESIRSCVLGEWDGGLNQFHVWLPPGGTGAMRGASFAMHTVSRKGSSV